jgi:two-component system cell cycle sensor histidine kinase/response regulator CckA
VAQPLPTLDEDHAPPSDLLQLTFWIALAVAVAASAFAIAWPTAVGSSGPILLIALATGGMVFLLWLLRGAGRRIGLFPERGAAEALAATRRSPHGWLEALSEPALLCDRKSGAPVAANAAYRALSTLAASAGGRSAQDETPVPIAQVLGANPIVNQATYRLMNAADAGEARRELLPTLAFSDEDDLRQYEAVVAPAGSTKTLWRLLPVGGATRIDAADGRNGFIEDAPIGFLSARADGSILYMNAALREFLGLPADAVGLKLADVMRANSLTVFRYERRGSRVKRAEVFLRTRAGIEVPVSVTTRWASFGEQEPLSRTVFLLPTAPHAEVTSRLSARSEFKPSGVSDELFAGAPIGLVRLAGSSASDAQVIDVNPAMMTLSNGAAMPGCRFAELFTGLSGKDGHEDALDRADDGGVELELKGDPAVVVQVFVARDMAGRPSAAYVIDRTETKALERRALESERREAVNSIGKKVAHEFNNILGCIMGHAENIRSKLRVGDPHYYDCQMIEQYSNRCARHVKMLLALTRAQTLKREVFNFTDKLCDQAPMYRDMLGEKIQLDLQHGRDLPWINADVNELETVLRNLIVNAHDAMDGRTGRVMIRTSRNDGSVAAVDGQPYVVPGDYLLIEVTDTGPGIPAHFMEEIFKPYQTTKGEKGNGIGLTTSMGIIKQLDGYIYALSPPGQGATFKILLPAFAGDLPAATPMDAVKAHLPDLSGRGQVLLVEDQAGLRGLMVQTLRSRGYDVTEAESAEEGLEILTDLSNRVDLIVSDIRLPSMDGTTMVREVRRIRPDVNVLFISGYSETEIDGDLSRDARVRFLQKPFSLVRLAEVVKEELNAARLAA